MIFSDHFEAAPFLFGSADAFQCGTIHIKGITVPDHSGGIPLKRVYPGVRCQDPGAGIVQHDIDRAGFSGNHFALRVFNFAADSSLEGGAVGECQRQRGIVSHQEGQRCCCSCFW